MSTERSRHDLDTPPLTAIREAELIENARRGCQRAKSEIIAAHLRLVRTIARRVTPRPSEDALAEGTLGLLEALDRFEPSFGVRFSTYAAHWVRALVTRHVLANRRMVPPPSTRAARRVLSGLGRAERKLAASDVAPTSTSIAHELGVQSSDVDEVLAAVRGQDISIGPRVDGARDVDPVADTASPEELVSHAEDLARTTSVLHRALARLPRRERHIVEARSLSQDARTLDDLAGELALSRERVRQLERRALDRLGVELRSAA